MSSGAYGICIDSWKCSPSDCDTQFISGQPIRKHMPNDIIFNDYVEYSTAMANRLKCPHITPQRTRQYKTLQYRALMAGTNTHNFGGGVIHMRYPYTSRGGVVVKALRYKPEGRGFDSRWCNWNFSVA